MKQRLEPYFCGRRHTARSLALDILLACGKRTDRTSNFVQDVLDDFLEANPLSPADRRLATHLVYTILRRQGTLFALLRPLLVRPDQPLEPWLQWALYLGACQLVLMDNIPPHAAVHETVGLAVAFGIPQARGFLNGVLRALGRQVTEEVVFAPAADAVPLKAGAFRRFTQPVLPNPVTHPVEYLSAGFSLPEWLARRWLMRFPAEECQRLGFWFVGPAPLSLRCNPLRCAREALLEAVRQAGIAAEPGQHPQAVRLGEPAVIRSLPGYGEGWFSVQDESAMGVASALAPKPGGRVLDLCAAPGGKATHLAELMQNRGEIIACDVDNERLHSVSKLAERLGLSIIHPCLVRADDPASLPGGSFDAVLADVPCSNTGVLGRRPEVRWRLRPEELPHLVRLQMHLLRLAAERLRRGGALVYSTCSMEPEENQGVVLGCLEALPALRLERQQESIPGQPADGGYWALLRRE